MNNSAFTIGDIFRTRSSGRLFRDLRAESLGHYSRAEMVVVTDIVLGAKGSSHLLVEISGREFVIFGAEFSFDYYFEKVPPLELLALAAETSGIDTE